MKIAGDVYLDEYYMLVPKNFQLTGDFLRLQLEPLTRRLKLPLEANRAGTHFELFRTGNWAHSNRNCPSPRPCHLFYGEGHEG